MTVQAMLECFLEACVERYIEIELDWIPMFPFDIKERGCVAFNVLKNNSDGFVKLLQDMEMIIQVDPRIVKEDPDHDPTSPQEDSATCAPVPSQ